MKGLFRNKIVIAIICFVLAIIVAFILVPANKKSEDVVNVVKVSKTISENTKITKDMLKTVELSADAVPSEAITDEEEIIGKYLKTVVYPTDFITEEKLSVIDTESNLYALKDGETAISITTKTLSKSVSGKILVGDAIQLYGYNTQEKELNEDSGKWYFEVLAIDNSKSENVSGASLDSVSDIVPATITVKAVSDEQIRSIVNMENNNDIQVVFAGRGEEANKLLAKKE